MDCCTVPPWCRFPDWCQQLQGRYTRREKIFLYLMTTSIAAFGVFLYVLIHFKDPVCYTNGCIQAAHYISKNIDQSVNPCDNFYDFVCGNFLKTAIQKDLVSTMKDLERSKDRALKKLVVGDLGDEFKLTKSFQYQRKFFRSCMNTAAIDQDEDRTFLNDMEYILGGWPLIEGFSEDLHWPEVMAKARQRGLFFNHFINVDIPTAPKSTIMYLEVSPPYHYHGNDLWNMQNIEYLVEIATLWGNVSTDASMVVNKTIDFAKSLRRNAERARSATMRMTLDEQKVTISFLKNLEYPKIYWLKFLRSVTGFENMKEDEIILYKIDEKYFEDLYNLIQNTPPKIWANYIATELLFDDCRYLSKKIETLCIEILPSMRKFSTRQDACRNEALNTFKGVAEAEYVRRYVSTEERDHIKEMVANIKEEIESSLKATSFMDATTMNDAVEHLIYFTTVVGSTDLVYNETAYETEFGPVKVNLSSDNVIEMAHEVNRFIADDRFANVAKLPSFHTHHFFSVPRLEGNDFFVNYFNILILIAPILQEPIYNLGRPEYLNYGALGSIIGHELTHVFTPNDDLSHPNAPRYWTSETDFMFYPRKMCIIKEYERYAKSIGVKLQNSSASLEENIADFNGVNWAYGAYQKWVKRNGYEKPLPGLYYNANQVFWIMSAIYMCKEPKLDDPKQAYSYPDFEPSRRYAMASFRVVGAVRSSSHFAEAFECPVGSYMNPEKKCKLFA